MKGTFKALAAAGLTAGLLVGALASASPASAAVGDNLVTNGGFDSTPLGAETAFQWADPGVEGNWGNHGSGTMYDPGTYTIASNPRVVHEHWATFDGDDSMMIVNGMDQESGLNSLVWAQNVTLPDPDAAYKFSMTAKNVLPQDGVFVGALGANLTVLVNGVQVGVINLTDEAAGVEFAVETGVSNAGTARIEIRNNTSIYTGNDFAIDDISLTQVPCDATSHGVWHVWTGGQTATAPAVNDPNWNAVSGDPQSANHRYENHTAGVPYFVNQGSKGKGDWFLWTNAPDNNCPLPT